jgi:hypothetical protein
MHARAAAAGWQYLHAHEPSQKYKEGRVILEKAKLAKADGWASDAAAVASV